MAEELPICKKCGTEKTMMKRGAFWFVGCPKCKGYGPAAKDASATGRREPKGAGAGKGGKSAREVPPIPKKGWADDWL